MSDELFSVPVSKSPKMRWLERHGVNVTHDEAWQYGDEDDLGNEKFPYYASDDGKHFHGGATEDDALVEWARARGKRLWNEEGL